MNGGSPARHIAQFVTNQENEAWGTGKHLPLQIASQTNQHIEIRFKWRNNDGSCIAGEIDMQIAFFHVILLGNAIWIPILLRVSFALISVTRMRDMISRLCMCKGRTCPATVADAESSSYAINELDIDLPVSVMSECKTWIWDNLF